MHDHFLGKDNCVECADNRMDDYLRQYPEFATRIELLEFITHNKKLKTYLFTRLEILRSIFEEIADANTTKRLWGRLHRDLKEEIGEATDALGISNREVRNQLIGFYRNVVKNYTCDYYRERDNPHDVIFDREADAFIVSRQA